MTLPRFQPDRLSWPWTPEQVEALDAMLEELYSDVRLVNRTLDNIATGDVIYGSATDTLAGLDIGTVGKILRSDGTLPTWSTFTIPDTFAAGDTPYASAANVLTGLTVGAAGTLIRSTGSLPAYSSFTIPDTYATGDILYGSATNVLTALVKSTTTTHYLSNTGVGNIPKWALVDLPTGTTGAITVAQGGTGQTTVATGQLLYGSATDVWSRLNTGSTGGMYLRNGGSGVIPGWSTLILPNAATVGHLACCTITNQITATGLAGGAAGTLLRGTSATTIPAYSTFTIPATFATGDIPHASATNVLTALADIATGNALISGGVGVAPSWGKIGLTTHVSGTLPVGSGGTGDTTLAVNGVLYGNTAGAILVTAQGAANTVLTANAGAPAFSATPTVTTLTTTGDLTSGDQIFERGRATAIGEWTTQGFSAGDFTGGGSMTWTVAAGDIGGDAYIIIGKTVVYSFNYGTTTVGGTPSSNLKRAIPAAIQPTSVGTQIWSTTYIANDNGTEKVGQVYVFAADNTVINFQLITDANWAASTDNTALQGTLIWEIP